MELEQWLREHPPEVSGLKAHATALQRLQTLGYTQVQMRDWLATQGLTVTRQAISKFFLHQRATTVQPPATAAQAKASARNSDASPCNKPTNPSAAPQPAPGETQAAATLKERAQAVGNRYLQQTLSPLAAQLLNAKPASKT